MTETTTTTAPSTESSSAKPRLQQRYQDEIKGALLQQFGYDNVMQVPGVVKVVVNMGVGDATTLRGDRMWEFLDRLVSIALPRIRDFRGLSGKQFDGNGNYTFGLTEQSMFHEIDQDRIDRVRGMDITVVTTATNDDEGRALLKQLGFPFKEN